jgi:hypothetical protein
VNATRPDIPSAAQAIAATIAVGRRLGLPVEQPEIIAEGYSVRVRLNPAPVVSRVVTAGRVLRGDPMPWLRREVDVARFLVERGAPIVAPWSEPGPFEAAGLEVSLWRWVEEKPGRISARDFGGLLRDLHAVLGSYGGHLPMLVGPLTDVPSALAMSDDAVLHAEAGRLLPLAQSWLARGICRPLHGDAHSGNVLLTANGPLWTDFEDACIGPIEWDLASTTLTDEAVAAYGDGVDLVRLRDCRDLRRLQILAGIVTDDVQDASLYDEIVTALRR